MEYRIGNLKPARGTVTVTFEYRGVTHTREVNACIDDAGKHDRAATIARVAEVARGVAVKIEAGVITNPAPEPEPETAAED